MLHTQIHLFIIALGVTLGALACIGPNSSPSNNSDGHTSSIIAASSTSSIVPAGPLSSLQCYIDPGSSDLFNSNNKFIIGDSLTMATRGFDAAGAQVPVTNPRFTVSPDSTYLALSGATAQAIAVGTVLITAHSGAITSPPLQAAVVRPTRVAANRLAPLYLGTNTLLSGQLYDSQGTSLNNQHLQFSAADPTIAQIDSTNLYGLSWGSTYIYTQYGALIDSTMLTVVGVEAVILSSPYPHQELERGQSITLAAQAYWNETELPEAPISFSSSDSNIATVSGHTLTAEAVGSCQIWATSAGVESGMVTITVRKPLLATLGSGPISGSGTAQSPTMAFFKEELFVAWCEIRSTIGRKLQIRSYTPGAGWGATEGGLVPNPELPSRDPQLLAESERLLMAVTNQDASHTEQLYVVAYQDDKWRQLTALSSAFNILNTVANRDAYAAALSGEDPFLVFIQADSGLDPTLPLLHWKESNNDWQIKAYDLLSGPVPIAVQPPTIAELNRSVIAVAATNTTGDSWQLYQYRYNLDLQKTEGSVTLSPDGLALTSLLPPVYQLVKIGDLLYLCSVTQPQDTAILAAYLYDEDDDTWSKAASYLLGTELSDGHQPEGLAVTVNNGILILALSLNNERQDAPRLAIFYWNDGPAWELLRSDLRYEDERLTEPVLATSGPQTTLAFITYSSKKLYVAKLTQEWE